MSLNRRDFLKIAGSSAIILPATACTTGTDAARQPPRWPLEAKIKQA